MMQMITKLSSHKENVPLTRPRNQQRTCCFCFSCGANNSHPSEKCTNKWKLAIHENQSTLKGTMGGSICNLKDRDVLKILNQKNN